jgi:outer membrane protein assembly factor BamB
MRLVLPLLLLVAAVSIAAPAVVNSFSCPSGVLGLAYAQGSLYAVTGSQVVYELDPATGAVLSQFSTTQVSSPNGLGYAGSLLYVTNGTSNVYKYTLTGTYSGATSLYVSG